MFTLSLRAIPKVSTAEHRKVADVILAGASAKAREIYAAHRRRGGKELMGILEPHGFQRL
ncbi:hypothetical protein SLNSH_01740 [Alsobacter soli]|uniref:Uncharacterized protein n=1 Tax=Alsobacter soli TaxID=2109933 RepID=A0A2T1HYA0_9HYPH|nr:hypothetical protein SLNSH_01740 [Alsobacter soli]